MYLLYLAVPFIVVLGFWAAVKRLMLADREPPDTPLSPVTTMPRYGIFGRVWSSWMLPVGIVVLLIGVLAWKNLQAGLGLALFALPLAYVLCVYVAIAKGRMGNRLSWVAFGGFIAVCYVVKELLTRH